MERQPNDFDQDILNILCDEKQIQEADNEQIEQDRNNWWDDDELIFI